MVDWWEVPLGYIDFFGLIFVSARTNKRHHHHTTDPFMTMMKELPEPKHPFGLPGGSPLSFHVLCVFITAVPNTKLFAWGEEDSGGHVL
jgi:hypothetical protein